MEKPCAEMHHCLFANRLDAAPDGRETAIRRQKVRLRAGLFGHRDARPWAATVRLIKGPASPLSFTCHTARFAPSTGFRAGITSETTIATTAFTTNAISPM